jgi:CheY-like chemotaxis protein
LVHFSVLLVDDDQRNVLDLAKKEFPDGLPIRLMTARDYSSALKLIKSDFFHLALIDPRLDTNQDDMDGILLLKDLKVLRPSCERIIFTHLSKEEYKGASAIAAQMNPIDGPAQGMINKTHVVKNFRHLINLRAEDWLKHPLRIEGAALVAERLRGLFSHGRKKSGNRPAITDDEIDFLVSRIFGQGDPWNIGEKGIGIDKVVIDLIPRQGFSAAAVAKAVCYSSEGIAGNKCVLKFAARDYIERELVRYSQYVRYRLAVSHRVELLGWAFADAFGALCYNFAGESSLSNLFLQGKQSFSVALGDLLAKGKQGWYSERASARLVEHFNAHYGLDPDKVIQNRVRATVDELENTFSGGHRGDRLHVCGVTLNLPNDVIIKEIFQKEIDACIVHGDLNCDNVLVDEDERPMLIDYYAVAKGPRAIDLAVLECDVRLLSLRRPDPDRGSVPDPRSAAEFIPQINS